MGSPISGFFSWNLQRILTWGQLALENSWVSILWSAHFFRRDFCQKFFTLILFLFISEKRWWGFEAPLLCLGAITQHIFCNYATRLYLPKNYLIMRNKHLEGNFLHWTIELNAMSRVNASIMKEAVRCFFFSFLLHKKTVDWSRSETVGKNYLFIQLHSNHSKGRTRAKNKMVPNITEDQVASLL